MASLYADENFNDKVVQALRLLGHDVLTSHEAGQAGKGIADRDVLAHATTFGRAVLTHDRRDYVKLHKQISQHSGIVACTNDRDYQAVAQRVHEAIVAEASLDGKLIRINKPGKAAAP